MSKQVLISLYFTLEQLGKRWYVAMLSNYEKAVSHLNLEVFALYSRPLLKALLWALSVI